MVCWIARDGYRSPVRLLKVHDVDIGDVSAGDNVNQTASTLDKLDIDSLADLEDSIFVWWKT